MGKTGGSSCITSFPRGNLNIQSQRGKGKWVIVRPYREPPDPDEETKLANKETGRDNQGSLINNPKANNTINYI